MQFFEKSQGYITKFGQENLEKSENSIIQDHQLPWLRCQLNKHCMLINLMKKKLPVKTMN